MPRKQTLPPRSVHIPTPHLPLLQVEITKTSDGLQDYIQLRSPAAVPVNIVLIADRIDVKDHR